MGPTGRGGLTKEAPARVRPPRGAGSEKEHRAGRGGVGGPCRKGRGAPLRSSLLRRRSRERGRRENLHGLSQPGFGGNRARLPGRAVPGRLIPRGTVPVFAAWVCRGRGGGLPSRGGCLQP